MSAPRTPVEAIRQVWDLMCEDLERYFTPEAIQEAQQQPQTPAAAQ